MDRCTEQAPETLVAFLDGRALQPVARSNTNIEPPRKRRKVTAGNAAKVLPPPAVLDDYLTLARIDLSIVRGPTTPSELCQLRADLGIPEKSERVIPFTFFRKIRTEARRKDRTTSRAT